MRVVDTSAWIEWLVSSELGNRIDLELPNFANWVVPTIVQYELARWLGRHVSEDALDEVIALSTRCLVTPLTTRTAVRAAELGRDKGLALADAIIYATALEARADHFTCDAHFKGLPGVVCLAKTAP